MKNQSQKPEVYAFIDSQNLNLGVQAVGWKMDWRRFRSYLEKQHNVTKAFMFIGYLVENESMYEQLHEAGYLIVLKPTVDIKALAEKHPEISLNEHVKDEPKSSVKGNIDADLVLYAMKELPNYDQAIIVSGDGDFYTLVEYLLERHKLKHIMTPNWKYSSLLKAFEPYIIRLDQQRRQLAYFDHGRRKPAQPS
ncbi:MAG TPA: NYN domain-containing protein [Candidatus Binatia bacterium]|jgi:uncharacterized LabA/DUF88 family protein|nr:NYN domain-containing protein [Candidatus Binatia bacterium]